MDWAAVCSKAVFYSLFIVPHIACGVFVFGSCFAIQYIVLCVLSSFAVFSLDCFTFIVFLMSSDCYCSLPLPHSALSWSAVCDCGISWLYSLLLLNKNNSPN